MRRKKIESSLVIILLAVVGAIHALVGLLPQRGALGREGAWA